MYMTMSIQRTLLAKGHNTHIKNVSTHCNMHMKMRILSTPLAKGLTTHITDVSKFSSM